MFVQDIVYKQCLWSVLYSVSPVLYCLKKIHQGRNVAKSMMKFVHLKIDQIIQSRISTPNIAYEHDRVDKITVDSTWQHVHMQIFSMWDQGSEVDLLVHTKSHQSCACYIAAMFDDRSTKNPKEQVERCLTSARKIV